jgi:hypothetical protein
MTVMEDVVALSSAELSTNDWPSGETAYCW